MNNMRTLTQNFILFFLLWCFLYSNNLANGYSMGDLGKRDIVGVWRFKNDIYPLKEFTVYPKKKVKPEKLSKDHKKGDNDDVLLLLREDGKFLQYHDSVASSSQQEKRPSYRTYKTKDDPNEEGGMEGTWAFVDGNLILAADRKPPTTNQRASGNTNHVTNIKKQKEHDIIFMGRVVASAGECLLENPALIQKGNSNATAHSSYNNNNTTTFSSSSSSSVNDVVEEKNDITNKKNAEDVHLSVPIGKVQIGKFFYPRDHPSFFEQPIFRPKSNGSFQLKQVLGTLNTRLDDEEMVEKFKKKDLMGKRYFLTSFPLQHKRKRRQRWSIKYNKYVDEIPKTEREKELEKRQKNSPIPIKTFEVELFSNNTFSTITGLGDMVLRGKWWIVGEQRDQLWMQVWRFGFGRSVSGSTFSEGSTLSQKDEVSYWGKIYKVDELDEDDAYDNISNENRMRVEINGSVMSGCGLEPCFTRRFTMIEKTEEDMEHYTDDTFDDGLENDLPELRDDIGSFE